jgi:GNAT superfamily N-acetyltransferase
MEIRTATEADIDGLVTSYISLFAADAPRDRNRNPNWPHDHGAEWTKANLANPDWLVLLAYADGTVVGHLDGAYHPPSNMWKAARATLISMAVHADWRSRGVGTQLVDRFKEWARERGAVQLRVTAYAANEGAIRFYRRNGFTPLEITFASAV